MPSSATEGMWPSGYEHLQHLEQFNNADAASTALSKLSCFRFLDKAQQKATMKAMIESIAANQSMKISSGDSTAMELTSLTTTASPVTMEILRANLPPASPTTLSLMLAAGQEVINDHGNDSTSDLSASGSDELTLNTSHENGVESLLLPKEELHGTFESLMYPPGKADYYFIECTHFGRLWTDVMWDYVTGSPSALAMHSDWENSMLSPRSLGGLVLSPMHASSNRFLSMLGTRDAAGGGSAGDSGKAAAAAASSNPSSNNWRFVSTTTLACPKELNYAPRNLIILSIYPSFSILRLTLPPQNGGILRPSITG